MKGTAMTAQQRDMVDQILRNAPFDLGGDVAAQRPILEQMLTSQPLPAGVRMTPGDLGGIPVIFIDIADVEPRGTIFHIHGGGFALGSAGGSVGLASGLARKTGMRAVSVDYRLAPEHPYPAAPRTSRPPTAPWPGRPAAPVTSSYRASRPAATSPSSSLSPARRRA
jgi:monoterpene epsilon-lactone hydrolase